MLTHTYTHKHPNEYEKFNCAVVTTSALLPRKASPMYFICVFLYDVVYIWCIVNSISFTVCFVNAFHRLPSYHWSLFVCRLSQFFFINNFSWYFIRFYEFQWIHLSLVQYPNRGRILFTNFSSYTYTVHNWIKKANGHYAQLLLFDILCVCCIHLCCIYLHKLFIFLDSRFGCALFMYAELL